MNVWIVKEKVTSVEEAIHWWGDSGGSGEREREKILNFLREDGADFIWGTVDKEGIIVLEGKHIAHRGDWIVKSGGEYYVVDNAVFLQKYELIEERK